MKAHFRIWAILLHAHYGHYGDQDVEEMMR